MSQVSLPIKLAAATEDVVSAPIEHNWVVRLQQPTRGDREFRSPRITCSCGFTSVGAWERDREQIAIAMEEWLTYHVDRENHVRTLGIHRGDDIRVTRTKLVTNPLQPPVPLICTGVITSVVEEPVSPNAFGRDTWSSVISGIMFRGTVSYWDEFKRCMVEEHAESALSLKPWPPHYEQTNEIIRCPHGESGPPIATRGKVTISAPGIKLPSSFSTFARAAG